MKTHYLLILFIGLFHSLDLYSQCPCNLLPEPTGTIIHVSTVSELQNALIEANESNGSRTILLEDGTYTLTNHLLYIGTHMQNLTIRSASGNRDAVIIGGQGMNGNVGWIFNVAASYFTLADVTIGWVANHPIQIHAEHNADFPLIHNVRFVDAHEQMLKVSGNASPTYSDGGIVQCSLFEFSAGIGNQWYTGGIDAHRAADWTVSYNTFKHIRSPDSQLAEHAIHFWSDSQNTLIENNRIIDCDRGIGFGLGNSGHQGGIIRNNMVHTSRDVGIGLESASDAKIYHNTVVTENYSRSIEYRFETTSNVHIANNLTTKAIASRNGGTGLVESNHISNDNTYFIAPNDYDFHLQAENAGAVIDAGIPLEGMEKDYDCEDRTSDNLPDIGADEYTEFTTDLPNFSPVLTLEIYPNPASEKLFVASKQALSVAIFSLRGQLLEEFQLPENEHGIAINVGGFERGVYWVRAWNGQGFVFRRVILD